LRWVSVAGLSLAVLLSTAISADGVPDARAASPSLAVGEVVDITWGISRPDIVRTVAAVRASGATWIRASVNWAAAEPAQRGVIDPQWLADTDFAIEQARAAGLNVLMPIADGVPYWASADPAKYQDAAGNHWNNLWRPTLASDYGAFAGVVARRYAAMGVHTYEIWNEPNTLRFWPSGPNAAQYTQLLAAAYPAIKASDPSSLVVAGGLSKNDYNYLQQMYAAGAKPYFDAVAVHPYTGIVDPTACWDQAGTTKLAIDAFCGIQEVHNTMVANGDAAKSIWLTEFGWSTTTGPYGVSEATQADFLTKALTLAQQYGYVRAAFWYNDRDTTSSPADYDDNLGLLNFDYIAKPAYAAMQSWTSGIQLRSRSVSRSQRRR
jgi:hypothetical protein